MTNRKGGVSKKGKREGDVKDLKRTLPVVQVEWTVVVVVVVMVS